MNMPLFCGPEVHTNINDKGISRESHIPRNVTLVQVKSMWLPILRSIGSELTKLEYMQQLYVLFDVT